MGCGWRRVSGSRSVVERKEERTVKSSSSFLPFFFFDPLRPSASTSSVIPRAAHNLVSYLENRRREGEERTVDVEIVHSAEVGLRLATDVADAVRFAAVAFLRDVSVHQGLHSRSARSPNDRLADERTDAPIAINVVVERQLLVHLDIALREDPHAHLTTDSPFGDDAIGVARVVEEATLSAFLRRVDELRRTRSLA